MKYTQRRLMTPLPHAVSFDALNAALEARCLARQDEHAGRHEETIGERLLRDLSLRMTRDPVSTTRSTSVLPIASRRASPK